MWFTIQRRQLQLPVIAICNGGHDVLSVATARNLSTLACYSTLVSAYVDTLTSSPRGDLQVLRQLRVRHTSVYINRRLLLADFGDVTRAVHAAWATADTSFTIYQRPVSIGYKLSRLLSPDCMVFNIWRTEHVTDSLNCSHTQASST
jgi:hypothetical protein